MGFFDWFKGAWEGKGKEIVKEVAEVAVDVAKDVAVQTAKEAMLTYLNGQLSRPLKKMRAQISRESKLSAASKSALNASLDSILQAVEDARNQ